VDAIPGASQTQRLRVAESRFNRANATRVLARDKRGWRWGQFPLQHPKLDTMLNRGIAANSRFVASHRSAGRRVAIRAKVASPAIHGTGIGFLASIENSTEMLKERSRPRQCARLFDGAWDSEVVDDRQWTATRDLATKPSHAMNVVPTLLRDGNSSASAVSVLSGPDRSHQR